MGDQYLLEHRERRLTRRVRQNRFRVALAIAAAEGILVIAGVMPWWLVVLLALAAVAVVLLAVLALAAILLDRR
jgi:hypothetical protein